jgi:hypothetical protein
MISDSFGIEIVDHKALKAIVFEVVASLQALQQLQRGVAVCHQAPAVLGATRPGWPDPSRRCSGGSRAG